MESVCSSKKCLVILYGSVPDQILSMILFEDVVGYMCSLFHVMLSFCLSFCHVSTRIS